jgi:hypothetical protein
MKAMNRLLTLGAVVAAFLAATPGVVPAADTAGDNVTIHYHRPDGSYDGWGLHTWESFQKPEEASDEFAAKEASDRPVKGVSWFAPLQQSGKDDFGVFWTIPAKEFGNGRVNYIIHKGDKKEQCNKDMFFMASKSKEAWVIAGDCKVYTSKDEALNAKKK